MSAGPKTVAILLDTQRRCRSTRCAARAGDVLTPRIGAARGRGPRHAAGESVGAGFGGHYERLHLHTPHHRLPHDGDIEAEGAYPMCAVLIFYQFR